MLDIAKNPYLPQYFLMKAPLILHYYQILTFKFDGEASLHAFVVSK